MSKITSENLAYIKEAQESADNALEIWKKFVEENESKDEIIIESTPRSNNYISIKGCELHDFIRCWDDSDAYRSSFLKTWFYNPNKQILLYVRGSKILYYKAKYKTTGVRYYDAYKHTPPKITTDQLSLALME